MHVHHDDAGLGLVRRREMFLDERLPCDGERVLVATGVAPILCKALTHLHAALEQADIAGFLRHLGEPRAGAGLKDGSHRGPIGIWLSGQGDGRRGLVDRERGLEDTVTRRRLALGEASIPLFQRRPETRGVGKMTLRQRRPAASAEEAAEYIDKFIEAAAVTSLLQ